MSKLTVLFVHGAQDDTDWERNRQEDEDQDICGSNAKRKEEVMLF